MSNNGKGRQSTFTFMHGTRLLVQLLDKYANFKQLSNYWNYEDGITSGESKVKNNDRLDGETKTIDILIFWVELICKPFVCSGD